MPEQMSPAPTSTGAVPLWLNLARLIRLPNVFSAPPDILAGFAVVAGAMTPTFHFAAVITASCLLYAAGMVWNDYFDVEIDRQQRPGRPLPSGAISLTNALILAMSITGLGILFGFIAGREVGLVAILLAGSILLYDGALKRTPVAPALMGLCRALNLLLGVVFARILIGETANNHWGGWVALANGIYITGVTLFARREAGPSPRSFLISGAGIMVVALIAQVVIWELAGRIGILPIILLGGFSLLLATRVLPAISEPGPVTVQRAVKVAVLGIIAINAATTAAFAGAVPGLIVLAHLIPALLIGRWIYST